MERLINRKNEREIDMICRHEECDTDVEHCPNFDEYNCPCLQDVLERIEKYEDIGLLPEQIKEIDKLYTEKCEELAKIQKENLSGVELAQIYAGLRKLEEYRELEKQGKLLKLPYAVGDTYFEIEKAFWINEKKCRGCKYYHEGSDILRDDSCCLFEEYENGQPFCLEIVKKRFESVREIISYIEDDLIRKTVFITREEAEAALK